MRIKDIWHNAALAVHFDGLTALGLAAVSAMLIFYSLEETAMIFTLCFAFSCFAGSAYGFMQGAWPFGMVECIWGFVALRKWFRNRGRVKRSRSIL